MPTSANALNLTVPPFDQVAIQIFTASGTYTPTTGMKYIIAEVVGSGGGGGGTAATGAGTLCASTGGGGAKGIIITEFLSV